MRIAVLSYGSLVMCPKSDITHHDIEVHLPFKAINGLRVGVRLGMCAYGRKLTTCIDESSRTAVQVYYALSLHDNWKAAMRAFALREGCRVEHIAIVHTADSTSNNFDQKIIQWLRFNNLDMALYANFQCTLTRKDAQMQFLHMQAETQDYALNRVPQPGGMKQLHDLLSGL